MLRVGLVSIFEAPIIFSVSSISLLSFAQADAVGPNYPSLEDSIYQPNLAVVIAILGVIFVLTILIILYARLRRGADHRRDLVGGRVGTSGRFSGLNKTVIESLPFFRFSSLKGSKAGLECSVCLSRFEGVEVLRLLPKCRHAFHVDCIDRWLERHSSCPLCRDRICPDDAKLIAYSNSMRFLPEPSSAEIFVQREESHRGSSRFSVKEELLVGDGTGTGPDERAFHRHNHKMVVPGLVFNNRWSNVSSSDLLFLSSEMLNSESNRRFVTPETNVETPKTNTAKIPNPIPGLPSTSRSMTSPGQQRSVSEITGVSRCGNFGATSETGEASRVNENEERVRRVWLEIAKRRVQWFANRETSRLAHNSQRQSIIV